MISFDIKNRFGGTEFTVEIDCDQETSISLKLRLAVEKIIKQHYDDSDYCMIFVNCDFIDADFSGLDLSYDQFICCDFIGADLTNANFSMADLRGSNFLSAKLKGADFFGADVRGAIFDEGLLCVNTDNCE